MMRPVDGPGASGATGRLWRIAILTAAGAIGASSQAEAALYYWSDSDPGYYQPGPTVPQRRQKARHRQAKRIEAPGKESAKPQGPLIIAISIENQKLKIYDANGFFAETPISTGMKGHPTPMGVFSIIQKHKLHHSNIYSGAPMPYMQRITWSGIAMHAGVLPGYPASHGCIRMPTAFAVKMWNWTKMGARVVVTPGEMTPASFSHPLLVAQKVAPQPLAELEGDAPPAPKSDKASEIDALVKPMISEASLELRSTVGHGAKPDIAEAPAPPRDQTRTVEARVDMPASKGAVTMTDAAPGAGKASLHEAAATESAPPTVTDAAGAGDVMNAEVRPGALKSEPEPAAAKLDDTAARGAPRPGENSDASVKTVGDASTNAPDVKKEQARLPDLANAVSKPDPANATTPKRTGQISVFISRKDSRLYVRQNFAPLFDAPIAIAPSERPLGTHVFTARVDKDDTNVLHWSVVSLPVPVRYAERRDDDERASRRRKFAGALETKPMLASDSAAEALDRLAVPADAMARIAEALSTGGSIIVSDQGITAGETGEGTDFIVSLR